MRTNIVLDDDLVKEAMRYSTAHTKRQLIHDALAAYIRINREKERKERYEERYRALAARLAGKAFTRSPHDLIREDREQR